MKKKGIAIALLASFLLVGCAAYEKKNQSGAAVEVNGQYLYRSTLDSLTLGLSPEDSTRIVQQYVSQWAKDILMYENAHKRVNDGIERMAEDYRRSLYVRAYEEYLVERRMPKTVADSTVIQLYMQMPDRFILEESIVRGILVVIPTDAPKADKLRASMAKQELDAIEKYAYQNASGYELFMDRWKTTTQLMTQMPMERTELEAALKNKTQVEVSDSLKIYILQVTEKYLRGDEMPLDYARPQIEEIVLNTRQADFLNKERERLYNEAIQNQKIKFYE